MNVIVEIPMEPYLICLATLQLRSPAYQLLRNGIIVQDEKSEPIVQILCSSIKANMILDIVGDVCPEFRAKLNKALTCFRASPARLSVTHIHFEH
jgi:hypothetical protein